MALQRKPKGKIQIFCRKNYKCEIHWKNVINVSVHLLTKPIHEGPQRNTASFVNETFVNVTFVMR